MAQTEVRDYRGLGALREAKSIFVPMYEEDEETNAEIKPLE